MTIARFFGLLLCWLWLGACSTLRPPLTPVLPAHSPVPTYDFEALAKGPGNTDETLVVVSLSGGGLRAAAFAYGVLAGMRELPVHATSSATWLDEIDVLSGVSGGSFTAAYYVARRAEFFHGFRRDVLEAQLGTRIEARLDSPLNWYRLGSPWFSTAHLMEQVLDREVFEGLTFGDLAVQSQRPFLLISATDLSLGTGFEFSREQFQWICADLNAVPISRAVTASSAVPLLIAPVAFRNYAGDCAASADADIGHHELGRAPDHARNKSYLDRERRPFVHLVDGGLVDNLAVRSLFDGGERIRAWSEFPHLVQGADAKIVLVLVDADMEPDFSIDSSDRTPSFEAVALRASRAATHHRSAETRREISQLVQRLQSQWQRAGAAKTARISLIQISLQQARARRGEHEDLVAPFGLDLPRATVDALIEAGRAEAIHQFRSIGAGSAPIAAP